MPIIIERKRLRYRTMSTVLQDIQAVLVVEVPIIIERKRLR